jgi:hypothetical protein
MGELPNTEVVRLAEAARQTFRQIAMAWSLTYQEQSALLGQPVEIAFAVLYSSASGATRAETLERASYLIGIYVALHNIFSDQRQADGWIRRPNTGRLFNGASALALMCSGQLIDLAAVREHLETNGMGPL